MSHCTAWEPRLHDHLDGHLSPDRRRQVESHLEQCTGCRETLEFLRLLRARSRDLADGVEPTRDLWPAIETGLRRGAPRRSGGRPGPGAWWRLALPAAAAGLLVLLTAWVTMRLVAPGGRPEPAPARAGTEMLEPFRSARVEYRRAAGDLLEVLERRREHLSPETVRVVEENLEIIDRAIREAWAALEQDPARLENGHLVTSLYRRKVALLQRAIELPAES